MPTHIIFINNVELTTKLLNRFNRFLLMHTEYASIEII